MLRHENDEFGWEGHWWRSERDILRDRRWCRWIRLSFVCSSLHEFFQFRAWVKLAKLEWERSDGLAPWEWCGSFSKTHSEIKRGMTIEIQTTRLWDLLEWLQEFTDNLQDTSACTRTQFSGLRFGTCHESGIKIKEAPFFSKKRNKILKVTTRKAEIAMSAW